MSTRQKLLVNDSEAQSSDEQPIDSSGEQTEFKMTDFPIGVYFIIIMEICERFSYYGLRALLVKYLRESLGFEASMAKALYSYFTCLAYISPIFGGLIADAYIGRFATIALFGVVYVLGAALLTFDAFFPVRNVIFFALILIAIGTGAIKSNVSTFGAEQLRSNNPKAILSYFSLFYACINLGSVSSTLLIPLVKQKAGYATAFSIPAAFLAISVIVFLLGRAMYIVNAPSGSLYSRIAKIFIAAREEKKRVKGLGINVDHALSMRRSRRRASARNGGNDPNPISQLPPPQLGNTTASPTTTNDEMITPPNNTIPQEDMNWIDYAKLRFRAEHVEEVKSVMKLIPVFLALPLFWLLYNQQGNSWVLQSDAMNRNVFGFTIEAPQVTALNAISILFLVPLFDSVIYPFLRKRGYPLKHLNRLLVGMIFALGAFALSAFIDWRISVEGEGVVPIGYQVPQFILMAIAEVLVSVSGLEFAYSQAPKSMKATIASFWLLTSAAGDLLAGIIFSSFSLAALHMSLLCCGLMTVNIIVFSFIARWFNKRTEEFYRKQQEAFNGTASPSSDDDDHDDEEDDYPFEELEEGEKQFLLYGYQGSAPFV